jgi:hypothetical protein
MPWYNQNLDSDLEDEFTHGREIEYLIPGIPPIGKYVELPHAKAANR